MLIGPGSVLDATSLIPGLVDVNPLSSQGSSSGFGASAGRTGRALGGSWEQPGDRIPEGIGSWRGQQALSASMCSNEHLSQCAAVNNTQKDRIIKAKDPNNCVTRLMLNFKNM